MPDQIAPEEIKDRAAQLRQVGQGVLSHFLSQKVGALVNVLAENPQRGHGDDFTDVHFSTPVAARGMVKVEIIGAQQSHVVGRPLP
jgi:threonylcarbamoyladenosine tRNA methylthiotransferase MtaB